MMIILTQWTGPAAVLLLALTCLGLARRQSRLVATLRGQGERLERLESDLRALCHGTAGLGDRLAATEQRQRDLAQRQETLRTREVGDDLYQQAVRLVHDGASAPALVERCGLTRDEAELIVQLHRLDRAS